MKKVALSFIVLLIFQIAVFAASEKSATVRLDQSVTVGSSTIKAGEYKVTWTEPGPDTKVIFTQGEKEIAVVPATVGPRRILTSAFSPPKGTARCCKAWNSRMQR
jgi:hypothetical protein